MICAKGLEIDTFYTLVSGWRVRNLMHTFRLSTFTSKNPSNWGVGESSIIIESAPARFSILANSFPVMDIR